MVIDFGLTDNNTDTGYYAGFLCAAVNAGRGIGSPMMGNLADAYGRKPILILSLLSLSIGSIMFGFARSYMYALLVLFISGSLSPLALICKTCVSEVTPESMQARSMAIYSMGFYYGQILGYSIGGLFVHPEDIGLVSEGIFVDYPYLLPNLICGVLGLLACVLVAFFFTETLSNSLAKSALVSIENRPLHFCEIRHIGKILGIYALIQFCSMIFAVGFPLWCSADQIDGGLGFDTENIGIILTSSSVIIVFFQQWVYGIVAIKYGLINTLKGSALALGGLYIFFPLLDGFQAWEIRFKAALVSGLLLTNALGFNIYTTIFVVTNNSVLQKDRGKVNGYSMAAIFCVRTVAPVIGGYLFAWSSQYGPVYPLDYHFIFTLIGFLCFLLSYLSKNLPKSLESAKEKELLQKSSTGIELTEEAVLKDFAKAN